MKFIKNVKSKIISPHYQRMRLFNAIFCIPFFVFALITAGPRHPVVWILGPLGLGSAAFYAYVRWRFHK